MILNVGRYGRRSFVECKLVVWGTGLIIQNQFFCFWKVAICSTIVCYREVTTWLAHVYFAKENGRASRTADLYAVRFRKYCK